MRLTIRDVFTHLAITTLFASLLTAPALAALDDGYPEGAAAPGRTCSPDAVGQKELSSYSGKNLSCILVNGVAKWWIDGDPIPAVEVPAASATPAPQASAPASDGKKFVLEKGIKITLKKGSKLITVGDVRPAQVLIPGTLKAKVAAPLLVALPGFTATPPLPGNTSSVDSAGVSTTGDTAGVVTGVVTGTAGFGTSVVVVGVVVDGVVAGVVGNCGDTGADGATTTACVLTVATAPGPAEFTARTPTW